MKNNLSYNRECLVYPGEYVPSLEAEELIEKLKTHNDEMVALPPVNITELVDSFKIEVAVPGVRREDFFIDVNEHVLTIVVLHYECDNRNKGASQLHEFDCGCFKRFIMLPAYADPEFTSAEYRQGILTLHIPKSQDRPKSRTNQIVVY
jgi:HSP20 family protein